MSKLLKSKFLLGAMVVAALFVGVFATTATSANADCTITPTLRVGSKGASVSCLQSIVGATADGSFGPKTKVAVMAYQASHGLTADGVVGPKTVAVLMAGGAVSGNFPAGCTSAAGYSVTTGAKCTSGPSTGLPAGCSSTTGFSVTTGAKCDGSSTGGSVSTGPLTGGAGDATITSASDTESEVSEGDGATKVLNFKVKADGGDIQVDSVKVTLENTGSGSTRLNRYLDTVTVYEGSTKVGSADVADFTKDGNVYSKSISVLLLSLTSMVMM